MDALRNTSFVARGDRAQCSCSSLGSFHFGIPTQPGCSVLPLLTRFILGCWGTKVCWWDSKDGHCYICACWSVFSSCACTTLIAQHPLGVCSLFTHSHKADIYLLTPHGSTVPGLESATLQSKAAREDERVKYGNESQKYSSNQTKLFGDKLF